MKKKDLYTLRDSMLLCKELQGIKFVYAISKNLMAVNEEITSLEEAAKPSKEFQEFEVKRVELAKKYSEKLSSGEPKVLMNQYIIDKEKQESFDKEVKALRKEYKEHIDIRDKQREDFEKFLEEESSVKLHTINMGDVPKEINSAQLSGIFKMINDKDYEA